MRALGRILLVASLLAVAACGDDSTPAAFDGGPADAPVVAVDGPVMDAEPTACDFFTSAGCALDAGEKCTATTEGPECGPAGTQPAGALCAGDQECPPGSMCAGYGGVDVCLVYCDGSHPCPTDPRQACFIRLVEPENPDNVIAELCGAVCSLLAQDCPPDTTLGCYPSATILPGEADVGLCFNEGGGVQGAECTYANDCQAGFLCVDQEGGAANMCAALCDLSDGDPGCTAGLTCRVLTGHTVTGACLP